MNTVQSENRYVRETRVTVVHQSVLNLNLYFALQVFVSRTLATEWSNLYIVCLFNE